MVVSNGFNTNAHSDLYSFEPDNCEFQGLALTLSQFPVVQLTWLSRSFPVDLYAFHTTSPEGLFSLQRLTSSQEGGFQNLILGPFSSSDRKRLDS